MSFKVLSFLIGASLLGKAIVALTIRERFYARRQRHYASPSVPTKLMIAPAMVIVATLAAWYATLFHYRAWSWMVTGFLTLLSCMAIDHLVRWRQHRETMLKVVTNPKVWRFDCFLLAIGGGFVALGLLVF